VRIKGATTGNVKERDTPLENENNKYFEGEKKKTYSGTRGSIRILMKKKNPMF
jgi:hypothetical protein